MNVTDLASQQATQAATRATENGSGVESPSELSGADDFSGPGIQPITLSTHTPKRKRRFMIQPLDAGHFFIGTNSPLFAKMTKAGVDLDDREAREAFLEKLSDEEKIEIGMAPEHLDRQRRVICEGVVSMQFVMARPHECSPGMVSVHQLSIRELGELFMGIYSLSIPDADKDERTFANFRSDGVQIEGADSKDGSDGGSFSGEALKLTLSEGIGAAEAGG